MIEITLTCAGRDPRKLRFEVPRIRIGRDADNEVVLDSQGCSRHHAEVVREGGRYKIVDLGSTNGVLYESKRIRDLILAEGTEVVIGQHRLVFSLPDLRADERTVRLDYSQLGAIAAEGAAAAAPPVHLYLVWGSGREERGIKILAGGEYILGRSPTADLRLDDRESSVRHAMVAAREGTFFIRDLESSNGTFVNGEKIDEAPLVIGDEIAIGKTTVRVTDQVYDLMDRGQLLERTIKGVPTIPEKPPEPTFVPEEMQAGGSSEARLSGAVIRPSAGPSGPPRRADIKPPAQPERRGRGFIAGAVAVVAVAAVAFVVGSRLRDRTAGTGAGAEPTESSPPGETLVQVTPVAVEELVFEVSGSGSVRARRTVTVSAEVPARVEELTAAEGTGVGEGALLVRLNDRDIRHQIDAATASVNREQLELARTDFERKQRLFDEGAVVRSVYEQAKNNYLTLDSAWRSTQAKVSQLREQLGKTRILAPIGGVVVKTFVNPGEFVAPGAPVVALENLEEVLVKVELADRDYVGVHLGQSVEATTDAFPGRVFRGEVGRLGSAANPVTRTFEVEARLLNPDHSLRTGMIVWLRIIQGKERGLVVPAEALIDAADDRAAVFAVRGGTVHRLDVRLGRRLDRTVQVLEGLAEDDEVVVFGQDQLRDGQSVRTYRKD